MAPDDKVTTPSTNLYATRLEPGQVRLLLIEQPSGRCSFETHVLSEAPKYISVSYTWGPGESTVCVDEAVVNKEGVPRYLQSTDAYHEDDDPLDFSFEIGGRQYPVSKNVHDFLSILLTRVETSERYWIDSLCINQEDVFERNAQVRMMGDIYETAAFVVTWLGRDEYGEVDTVVSMCEAIQAEFWRQLDGKTGRDAAVPKLPYFFEPGLMEQLGLPNAKDDAWHVFARFWDRRWFHRAWVIQEITLANDPRIWYVDGREDPSPGYECR